MLISSHLTIGATVGALASVNMFNGSVDPFQYSCFMAGCIVGSALPDIDHPNSTITKKIPAGWIVSKLFSHRGFFHSLLGTAIIFVALMFISVTIAPLFTNSEYVLSLMSAFTAGTIACYMMHIIADMLTNRGVRLFYPAKTMIGLGLIRTGSILENLTIVMFVVVAIYAFIQMMESIIL